MGGSTRSSGCSRRSGSGAYLGLRGQAQSFYTHAGNASVGHEWETPKEPLEALHSVFGRFDLDPVRSADLADQGEGEATPDLRGRWALGPVARGSVRESSVRAYARAVGGEGVARGGAGACKDGGGSLAGPARHDLWHKHAAGRAVVYFLKGRLRFGSGEQSAPFPSALAVWGADPVMLASLGVALPGAWRAG